MEKERRAAMAEAQSDEKLLQQLSQYVDLYKFYWNVALKLMMFTTGASGAVAAYCIKNENGAPMELALILPFLLCVFCIALSHFSLPSLKLMKAECFVFAKALKLTSLPDFSALILFSMAVRYLFGLTAIGLSILFVVLV